MDVAAMSIVMSQHQVRSDASLALMDNVMDRMKQQSTDLTKMLLDSTVPNAPHPSLGNKVDVSV